MQEQEKIRYVCPEQPYAPPKFSRNDGLGTAKIPIKKYKINLKNRKNRAD
jgi:hypothetical protein